MVFYFSGTGNSQYVANCLAKATGERLISIEQSMAKRRFVFFIEDEERIGFVTFVYFGGLPVIVIDFVRQLILKTSRRPFTYHVLTYGTTTGQAHHQMKLLLKAKGLELDGQYNVRMVDMWTPLFNLSNRKRCLAVTNGAEPAVKRVVNRVMNHVDGNFDSVRFPAFLARIYYRSYNYQRLTTHFHVLSNRCIGCNLCVRCCPVRAIAMRGGYPEWILRRCVLCLRCLHQCPTFAIQYGRHTISHGQFVNPNVGRKIGD